MQIPKQLTVFASTAAVLGPKNWGLLSDGASDAIASHKDGTWQKEAIRGRQIEERAKVVGGLEKLGDVTTKKAIVRGDEGAMMEGMKKFVDWWANMTDRTTATISIPDAFAATSSWFAYYRQYLKKQGVDLSSDDWKTQRNDEAASYANQMVERTQNANTPEAMPLAYRNRNVLSKALMDWAFAFSSFALNQRKRIARNTDIILNGSPEAREMAWADTRGVLAETFLFATVSTAAYIFGSSMVQAMLDGLYGDDEEEKERRKELKERQRGFAEKAFAQGAYDLVFTGLPEVVGDIPKTLINVATRRKTEDERKVYDLYYVPKDANLGVLGAAFGEVENLVRTQEAAMRSAGAEESGLVKDRKYLLDERQKSMLRLSQFLSFIHLVGLSDQTFTRGAQRDIKQRLPMEVRQPSEIAEGWLEKAIREDETEE